VLLVFAGIQVLLLTENKRTKQISFHAKHKGKFVLIETAEKCFEIYFVQSSGK
jgi:hypothetical protein